MNDHQKLNSTIPPRDVLPPCNNLDQLAIACRRQHKLRRISTAAILISLVLPPTLAIAWHNPKQQQGAERSDQLVALHKEEMLEGQASGIESVAFAPDGKTLASAGSVMIKLWDVKSRRLITTLRGHTSFVTVVAFSPDGKTLASASDDHTIKLWDVAGRQVIATLKSPPGPIRSVAFSPDGKTLASASWDRTVRLWEVKR